MTLHQLFTQYAFPKEHFDSQLAYQKKMSQTPNALSESYFSLQQVYRQLLSEYLNQQLPLKELDRELEQLGLPKMSKELSRIHDTESYYQSLSLLDSDYIYLRNNLFIERLTLEQLSVLDRVSKGQVLDQTDLTGFIEETMPIVLAYDCQEGDYLVKYEAGSSEPKLHRNDIVFYLVDGKFVREENRGKWGELYGQLDQTLTFHEVNFSEKLRQPSKIYYIW